MDIQDVLTINPELAGPIPCRVKFTPEAKKKRLSFFLLFVISTLILFLWSRHDLYYLALLQRRGIITQSTIYDKDVSYGKVTYFSLRYEYAYKGQVFRDSGFTDEATYDKTNIHDLMTVTFLPDRPAIHETGIVTEDRLNARQTFWEWIEGIVATLFGSLFLWLEIAYQRQFIFLKSGYITMGEATGRRMIGSRSQHYCVYYSFFVHEKQVTGSAMVGYNLYQHWTAGSAVAILYNPRFPRFSLPCSAVTHATLIIR